MSKNQLHFDFYGIGVSLTDPSEQFGWVLQQLVLDFGFFSVPATSNSIEIVMQSSTTKPKSRSMALFSTRMCKVRQTFRSRICIYSAGTEVHFKKNCMVIFGENLSEIYQAAYYFTLSRVGEMLDLKGLHRIHAVAIQTAETICRPMDSLGGKTSAALNEIFGGNGKVLGDEIVLTDGIKIYPCPIRMAVRPDVYGRFQEKILAFDKIDRLGAGTKYLVPIPESRVGAPSEKFKIVLPVSWHQFSFFWRFLIGWGLPQMSEFLLRPTNIFSLIKIGFSRGRVGLLLRSKLAPAAVP